MIPTIRQFTEALLTPDLSLRTLTDARALTDLNGLPHLERSTRFAEARIEWQGRRWLLSMPLSPAALPRIERTLSTIRRLTAEWLAPCRILPGELRWQHAGQQTQPCDLLLQLLPDGHDFAEALLIEQKETLLAALDTLEAGMRQAGFTHHNLKAENLRWSGGRWIPLRYHDARIGLPEGSDAEAFEALRRRIEVGAGVQQTVRDAEVAYDPMRRLTGHIWTSNLSEGLVVVEDESGFGYVDADNNPVIEARFQWAGDFHEGRAEVQTPTGMGLIDREGNYVLAPEYEIVEYDPARSTVQVRQNGRWALFDYLGRRLTEFSEHTPSLGSEIC